MPITVFPLKRESTAVRDYHKEAIVMIAMCEGLIDSHTHIEGIQSAAKLLSSLEIILEHQEAYPGAAHVSYDSVKHLHALIVSLINN